MFSKYKVISNTYNDNNACVVKIIVLRKVIKVEWWPLYKDAKLNPYWSHALDQMPYFLAFSVSCLRLSRW
jgi:hypothetical protein